MKKRLLLLLIIPLVASCGHKNSGSNEQSSNEESSIISESSESTSIISSEYSESSISSEESESSESSSDSSSSEEPIIIEEEDIEPFIDFNPNELDPVNDIAMEFIISDAISNIGIFNYHSCEEVRGNNVESKKVYGPFEKFVGNRFTKDLYEEYIYADDLAYKANGSFYCYDTINIFDDIGYYCSYDYINNDYYTAPDEFDNTVETYYEQYDNCKGHEIYYDYYFEDETNKTMEDILDSLFHELNYQVGNIETIIANFYDYNFFMGVKEDVYYVGYTDKKSSPIVEEGELNYAVINCEEEILKCVSIKKDLELGFVFDGYIVSERRYAYNNIFGEEFDERVLLNYHDADVKFEALDLGSYEKPIVDEARLHAQVDDDTWPMLYYFFGSVPLSASPSRGYFNSCGSNDGEYYFSCNTYIENNNMFSIDLFSNNALHSFELLDNDKVNWIYGKNYIEAVDDSTYPNVYRCLNDVYLFMFLTIDIDGNLIGLDFVIELQY